METSGKRCSLCRACVFKTTLSASLGSNTLYNTVLLHTIKNSLRSAFEHGLFLVMGFLRLHYQSPQATQNP